MTPQMEVTGADAHAHTETEYPWVLFRLGENTFGITAELVESMVQLPDVTPVPHVQHDVRGVMNLRGRVLRVVDLRIALGLPPLEGDIERFIEFLDRGYHDHTNWAEELVESFESGAEFHGERDPTKCAFGRWLETLETGDVVLSGLLERVRAPHERLHGMANHIDCARREGDQEEVQRLIGDVTEHMLPHVQNLIEATKDAYHTATREVALVVSDGRTSSAVVVDRVLSVEHLANIDAEAEKNAMANIGETDLVMGMAKRPKDEALVLLLDGDQLIS